MITTTTAEHEAAHVVVGVALGLKLLGASASPNLKHNTEGHALFRGVQGWGRRRLAFGIMYCAGVAYERRPGGNLDHSDTDFRLARACVSSVGDVQTGIRVADEIMAARRRALARVAAELLDGTLGPRDIERLSIET